jgi:5-(carboxyamino)imidazole ribonucleotide synthase
MQKAPVIALLGGGQLGRMFIENALRYNVRVSVLDPDPQAPCALLAERFVVGDFNDRDTVLAFAADADVLGIEIEHVSVEALELLAARGKRVIPDPAVLRTIQDKGAQKQFYADHALPTSPFILLEDGSHAAQHPALFPAFLKSRTGGYDGKGVMKLSRPEDAQGAFQGPCVLEQQVDIDKELAVIVVRSAEGTMVTYDPVEMVFDPRYNLVDHLRAPAFVEDSTRRAACALAERVAEAFHAPGIYAVELFLTSSGELLVNETAPRAHNSGHHTIEACDSSQFDQLLRLYMGWPLGSSHMNRMAAMINLVGEGGSGRPFLKGMEEILHLPGTYPHLYGKHETRSGRKMGHITVTAASEQELEQAIAVAKEHCSVVPAQRVNGDHQHHKE